MSLRSACSALVLTLMTLQTLGCYTWIPAGDALPPVSPNPRKQTPRIRVYANDGSVLEFSRGWRRDGVVGGELSEVILWNRTEEVPDRIPVSEVWWVELKEVDGPGTALAAVTVVGGLVGLLVLAVMAGDWSS